MLIERLIERIVALLGDFQEHARESAKAQPELEEASIDSDKFHGALGSLTAWLGGLQTLVPGILSEIEELESSLDEREA